MTSDVVMLRGQSGQVPPVVGKAAFESLWTEAFAKMTGANPYAIHPHDVAVAGAVAAEAGEFGPEGAAPMGRYVLLYDRGADGWKIAYWKFFRSP